ncbi:hypothetical protein V4V35_25785 [Bacillus infantis]|uniref:hypothetical protein n=1 Tax=Bacillus infantis TaxID=324767 RepID=UPI002FBF19DC
MKRVQSDNENIQALEVGKTKVFVRRNISKVDVDGLSVWEYDEEQYDKDYFISTLKTDNERLELANLDTMEAAAVIYENNLMMQQQLLDNMDATAMLYEEILQLKGV